MFSKIMPSNPISPLEGQSQSIIQCWDFSLNQGEALAPHKHPDVEEVYIILNGEGIMTVGNKTSSVMTGEVIYIPLNTVHFIINAQKEPLRCLTIVARIAKKIPKPVMTYSLN